jgi:hypothetical protein
MRCRAALVLLASLVFAFASTSALAASNSKKTSARLFGSPFMKGHAKYQERSKNGKTDQRFNVHISRALPLQTLEVSVNGQPVGTVVTNFAGNGKLHLRTGGKGSADPLPDGFPSLGTGDIVSVGPLTGICFGKGDDAEFEVKGEVDVNGAEYEASYRERIHHGALERTFEAEIEVGEISQDVPVFINDVFFGTVSTDVNGNGELELSSRPDDDDGDEQLMPDDFPSLQPGDVVRIGNTLVTLAADDDDDGQGDDDDGDDDGDDGGGGDD